MPSPLPNPIRILVKGPSNVSWSSPMGGPRTNFAYPRATEEALLQAGHPVEMRTFSVPSERTKTAVRRWEREMVGWAPDVVVLPYGQYETVHLFLPWWLERHANSRVAPWRRWSAIYRTYILWPIWKTLAKVQSRIDKRIDPTIRRNRPKKVVADLEKIVHHTQEMHSALVILFELLPPSTRYHSWFPGMARRTEVMNQSIQEMVERINLPNVRYFRVSPIVDKYFDGDLDAATPDGAHFTPELHRRVGEELAREIAEWADTQPHLQIETTTRSRLRSVRPSEPTG